MSITENPELMLVEQPAGAGVVSLGSAFTPISPSALIILNQQITIPRAEMVQLWGSYGLKLCADGGANRLYDFFEDNERENFIPDFIVGDLDSLKDSVKQWYQCRGVRVIKQTTQYATDMHKCLDLIELYYDARDRGEELDLDQVDEHDGLIQRHSLLQKHHETQVLMLGAIDGRFDHTIQSISTLIRKIESNPLLRMFYLTHTDLIFVLPRGTNYVEYANTHFHGYNCGLLPLAGQTVLTTRGLKWDVTEWPSSLKGNVSSSNRFVGEKGIVVGCDCEIIVSVELDRHR